MFHFVPNVWAWNYQWIIHFFTKRFCSWFILFCNCARALHKWTIVSNTIPTVPYGTFAPSCWRYGFKPTSYNIKSPIIWVKMKVISYQIFSILYLLKQHIPFLHGCIKWFYMVELYFLHCIRNTAQPRHKKLSILPLMLKFSLKL